MRRISTATRAVDLFGAGKDGFKDGNLALGVAPTDFNADWPNQLQEEVANAIEGAGIALDGAVRTQLLQAILKLAGGSARVKGLVGANNSATPNTQFDFICSAVDLRNPATGALFSVVSPASKTCNILTAGPAANGRDQAGAFSASSWVHFYYIYNPATSAIDTIASASASAPAALPAGCTAWAYIGAVRLSAGSALSPGYFRGSWFEYAASVTILSGGGSTTRVGLSTAAIVPPNALRLRIDVPQIGISAGAGGNYGLTAYFEISNGPIAYQCGLQGVAPASGNVQYISGGFTQLPNVGQNLNYYVAISTGAGPTLSVNVGGYSFPNGGE